jgi:Domain of unknown function (DUF1906)
MIPALSRDSVGCDTSSKLDHAAACRLSDAGLVFVVRYVSIGYEGAGDIDADEASAITDAGLALMLVQHVRRPPWSASASEGLADGGQAHANALAAGYPEGCTLWCDLEGVEPSTPTHAIIDYCQQWSIAIAPTFEAGLYVGYGTGLTSEQLYALHGVVRYWSDFGNRTVTTRGFCMKQLAPPDLKLSGVDVDLDVCHADELGSRPTWAVSG